MFKKLFRKIKSWYIGKTIVSRREVETPRTVPLYYTIAMKELGVKETVGPKHTARVLEYHSTTGKFETDEVPWCSSFVNWCMIQARIKGTDNAMARSWLNWGRPVTDPQVGDVVVFWRKSPKSVSGHVGFYAGREGGSIIVLGGNQANMVCYQKYSAKQLLGYRRL